MKSRKNSQTIFTTRFKIVYQSSQVLCGIKEHGLNPFHALVWNAVTSLSIYGGCALGIGKDSKSTRNTELIIQISIIKKRDNLQKSSKTHIHQNGCLQWPLDSCFILLLVSRCPSQNSQKLYLLPVIAPPEVRQTILQLPLKYISEAFAIQNFGMFCGYAFCAFMAYEEFEDSSLPW